MKKTLLSFISITVTVATLLLHPTSWAKDPLQVAFVYVSPIGDAGWSYQHDQGRLAAIDKFGDKITTKYIESVNEGADAERVIRKLASSGYDLIFTTSFGYMNPTLKIAKQFPKVIFEHASGYKTAKNMGNYLPRFYEGRYLAGMAAGAASASNLIGYIAAFPIPEVVRGINAFTLGAQSVNPAARVKVIWTNAWFDPSKETEAANSLIAQGADLLTHHTDSVAVVKAAKDKNIPAIAYHSDMQKHAGKAQLGAVIHVWDKFYIDKIQQVLDGTWQSGSLWQGIPENLVDFKVTTNQLDSEVVDKIDSSKAQIAAGRLHPFTGPIYDQKGEQKAKAGEILSDSDLLSMDYFVRGVSGRLGN